MIFKLLKLGEIQKNRGMSYAELIVVLSIFSIVSGIAVYNHGSFQGKIDIKNLANDIALRVVEAQKSASLGKFQAGSAATWRPAYGVYFDLTANNKAFTLYADKDGGSDYDGTYSNGVCSNECLEYVQIQKNNYINSVKTFVGITGTVRNQLNILFKRPNLSPQVLVGVTTLTVDYVEVEVKSPKGNTTAWIKIYPSGMVKIN